MKTAEELPFVSIVMPVRNEANYIERSLAAVLAQDYPVDRMEILLADGMSEDETRQIVHSFQSDASNIKIVDNIERIVPTGLNAAIRQARGEIIIRVDGHCVIAGNYVSRCVEHLKRLNLDAVGGPIDTVGETFTARVIAIAMSSLFGVGGATFRTVKDLAMDVDTVAFPAYRREAIQKTGLFDEELVRNQDDEYNYRLRSLGGKLMMQPEIRSCYFSRTSLNALWRQYFQYGYWKVRVLQKHPRQMRLRQFIPPTFVFSLLVAFLLIPFTPLGFYPLLFLTASYMAADLISSVYLAAQSNWVYLGFLPIVFLMLHLSYGMGFLVGMVKFASRWNDRQGKVPAGRI